MERHVVMTVRVMAFVSAVALASGTAGAQEPPAQPPVAVPPGVAAPVTPAPQVPPLGPVDPQRRREQIVYLEGALMAAVRNGAIATAREIQNVQPGVMFTGNAKAKGFSLEGYGLFFHVEIPGMQQSVAWLVQTMERERAERQVPPGGQASRAAMGASIPLDPNATYTDAVKQKIIDVMVDINIDLRAEEWLSVAARDGDAPMVPVPAPIYESITMIFRVKGSDLGDFRAGRLTREEIRKRVEVKEF